MTASTIVAATSGTPQYMSRPNTIAGGSDPHVPGATGSHPNPKHVAIHRFQAISCALRQEGMEAILKVGKFRTDRQEPSIIGQRLPNQTFPTATGAPTIAKLSEKWFEDILLQTRC